MEPVIKADFENVLQTKVNLYLQNITRCMKEHYCGFGSFNHPDIDKLLNDASPAFKSLVVKKLQDGGWLVTKHKNNTWTLT
jgi:hypothetical protein